MALRVARVMDEAGARAFAAIEAVRCPHDHAGLEGQQVEDVLGLLPDGTLSERVELYVGYDADRAVSVGAVGLPLRENQHVGYVWAAVLPAERGRGFGRETALFVLGRARGEGRRLAIAEIGAPIGSVAPGDALARSLGGAPALESIRRELRLADVDIGSLATRLDEEVRPAAVGYEAVRWLDHVPAALADGAAALLPHVISDAPLGDLELDDEVWDASRYHEYEATVARRGRRLVASGAVEVASGRLVAYTDLTVPSRDARQAQQWGTIVEGSHRGHRLGLLVKTENLLQLCERFDEVASITTQNAAENRHMIAVNEQLGFRPVERYRAWQVPL